MFGETIRAAAERFGDRVLLREESGRSLTYGECDELSDGIARAMLARGVREGSPVAITLGSGIDYLLTYAAAAKLGAIAAGVNPSLTDTERRALVDLLEPDLVVDAALEIDPTDRGPLPDLGEDPERIVAIVFTSGTTGLPKGAIFRNRQLAAIAEFDLGPDWRTTWGPGGHMFASTQFAHVGFMTKLPWYFHAGLTLHCLDRWRAEAVLRLIDRYRISTLGVVAPQLAIMLRHPLMEELDVSCVNQIIAGGAASSPSLMTEAITAFGAGYSVRYSSTESGGIGLATAFDAPLEETLTSVGRARPGVEAMVIDPSGSPLPPGEAGQLCLRTPTAFDGYWRNPEATSETLVDGWIRTGDLASIDPDGLVHIVGRTKEMYIRGGYNVAPAEVEAVLGRHPGLREVAIAVRPDPVMGEIGVAVVCGANPDLTLQDLREFGAQHLAAWKLPEAIVFADEIPLTPMQKLDRQALRELAAGDPQPGGA